MSEPRYSKREALNRLLRLLMDGNDPPFEGVETLSGVVYSEDDALSKIAELIAGTLGGEDVKIPTTYIPKIQDLVSNLSIINGSGTAGQITTFIDADTITSTSNIYVTGTSVFIGGITDSIRIDNGGKLSLIGTATVFDDLQMQLIGQRLESPSSDIVQNNAEGTLSFKSTATLVDYVTMNVQNTHRWSTGTAIHPHLHWFQSNRLMPNWMIQVRVQVNGQTKTTAWTNYKWTTNAYTYVTGTLNQMSEFGELQITGTYSISDIFQFRIIRDSDNDSGLFTGTSDGLSANAEALSFDCHIEMARGGSNGEYTY